MNTPHVIAYVVDAVVIIAVVAALAIWIARRYGGRWALWSAGALTFIASQVVHAPVLALVTGLFGLPGAPHLGGAAGLVLRAVALGLFAGVCEEVARWIALRFALKHARTWGDGLMFGAGHGGIEAILVAVSILSALASMVALTPAAIAKIPADQQARVLEQQQAFWNAPLLDTLAGPVERIFAMCLHLACALLVLEAVRRRAGMYLLAAICWHALSDVVAVMAQPLGVWPTEGLIGLCAIASVVIVVRMRRRDTAQDREISDSVAQLKSAKPFGRPAGDPAGWTTTRPEPRP